jgi:hypothetical protein
LKLLFEYLTRMSFNSWVLLAWAYAERERQNASSILVDPERAHIISDLIEHSTTFRLYIFLALPKLAGLLAMHTIGLTPARNVALVRRVGQLDGLDVYLRMATLAEIRADAYGGDLRTRMASLLRGV